MKKILFFSLILLCMTSFACGKKKKKKIAQTATTETTDKLKADNVWMEYDETKCQNPWHFNWLVKPTEGQLLGAVKSNLTGQEITILEIRSSYDEGLLSCEACTCPNGRHFYVRVSRSQTEKLKALNFYEIKSEKIPATALKEAQQ